MEVTIDRASYRRSARNITEQKNEHASKCTYKKVFLNEIIVSMAVLIGVLISKFIEANKAIEWIDNKINSGIQFENLYTEVIKYYENIKNDIINVTPKYYDVNRIEENINEDNNLKINTVEESISSLKENDGDICEVIKSKFNIISPLNDGVITSKFGYRESDNPIVSTNHEGLDIAANIGATIVAAHDGIVIKACEFGTYGNCIMIENESLTTVYAHCSKINIKKGEKVKQGDKIGEVGMTGNATGPHVHFEIRYNGEFINPEDII